MYSYVQLCTVMLFRYVQLRTATYSYVQLRTATYSYVQLRTATYATRNGITRYFYSLNLFLQFELIVNNVNKDFQCP
jgi:hypothetical protein